MLRVQSGATKLVILFEITIYFPLCGHRIGIFARFSGGSVVVVIVNEARDSAPQSGHVILWVQVDVFPLDGPPHALYPDVVQAPCSAVNADLNLTG